MSNPTDPTVAELVLEHPEYATLLRERGIRYCCDGEQTLAEACAAIDRKVSELLQELEQIVTPAEAGLQLTPGALSTEELLEHIVNRHHDHVWGRAPFLAQMAAELAALQLDTTRDLFPIAQLMKEIERALTTHLRREEGLYRGLLAGAIPERALATSLALVAKDHAYIGKLVERLRRRTKGYVAPPGASNAHKDLFRELDLLDEHVRSQVLLEDHVLNRHLEECE